MSLDEFQWPQVTIADLASGGLFRDGDWVESKDQDPNGSVRLTQLADVGVANFRNRSDRWMRPSQAAALNCTFLQSGDILIARMPDPIGRACVVPEALGPAVTAVDIAILRIVRPDVNPQFVLWAINSPRFHQSVVLKQSGTTRKRISRKNLAGLSIPLPPLPEQLRIVEAIEDHLSRLDEADAGLERLGARLGALEIAALGKCQDGRPTDLETIAEIQGGIQKQPKRAPRENSYPFLRVANVTKSGLDLTDVHRIELFRGEIERFRLRTGDLLVVEGNGSPSQIGRAAMWDGSIPDCVHQNHLIRVRPAPDLVLPSYLEAVWNSHQIRNQLTDLSSSSSGLHTLSVSKLKSLRIPVPSMSRQHELVEYVNNVRAEKRRVGLAVVKAASRSRVLRRAVLVSALCGRLTNTSMTFDTEELAHV